MTAALGHPLADLAAVFDESQISFNEEIQELFIEGNERKRGLSACLKQNAIGACKLKDFADRLFHVVNTLYHGKSSK
jgi:hypothetical protein